MFFIPSQKCYLICIRMLNIAYTLDSNINQQNKTRKVPSTICHKSKRIYSIERLLKFGYEKIIFLFVKLLHSGHSILMHKHNASNSGMSCERDRGPRNWKQLIDSEIIAPPIFFLLFHLAAFLRRPRCAQMFINSR